MLPPERTGRRRLYLACLICVALGIVLGVLHNRVDARGHSDPVTSAVRVVTVPIVRLVGGAWDWAGRETGWIFHARSADAENRRLRSDNGRLLEENARLREAEAEAQRLRGQLGFAQTLPPNKIAARVIALRPDAAFDTVVIDRGSLSGVHLRSVVVAPAGIVGQVYNVAPTSATVMLLTDDRSAVGARVQRPESRAVGVCRGDRSALLGLLYLDQDADVRAGDVIVSSGLGGEQGVYPKGLVIGTVATVSVDASGSSRNVKVRPAVEFSRLEEVYVLR